MKDTIHILIVEDDPIIAADIGWQLRDLGMEVAETCETGEEALVFLAAHRPNLILMDIQLAGDLDGIQTAIQIREKYDIPLIFLTSNTDEKTFSQAKAARPAAFLSKPFRSVDLRHAIDLAISQIYSKQSPPPKVIQDASPKLSDRLFVKDKDTMVKLQLADILWAEADGYYCKLTHKDKTHLLTYTLKKLEDRLPKEQFLRIHRSFIINLNHLNEVGDIYVTIGKQQIPIGKSYREELYRRLHML
jgi:DNA-binding LytR/AlgR family response regulator